MNISRQETRKASDRPRKSEIEIQKEKERHRHKGR